MPSLTWRITDRTRLDLMAYLHRDPEGGSHSGLPYQGTVVPYNGGKISNTFFEGEDDYDKYDRRENMVGYNIEHLFDNGWSVRQKLRYLHTKVTLNQVYAAGWLNETALNRGYSGSGEKMSAIALDNQLDGSVDTGAINHRLLVGIDYQDRSNHTTGYYGAFPPIDAFNPVYGAQPDYITLYSREKHKLRQTGYYLQDQMSWDRWRFTLGGRYDRVSVSNIDKLHDSRSDLDKNNVSTRAALLYLFDNGVAPYLSYSTAFTPTSFADENGNVLEPMKGKQWEAGVKYEPLGGIASLAPPCIVLTRPISRPKKNLPIRTARLVKLSLKGWNWRPLAICRIASVCRRRIPILISVIRKVARKSRVSARFMLHGTRPAPG